MVASAKKNRVAGLPHLPFGVFPHEVEQLFDNFFHGDGHKSCASVRHAPASLWEDDDQFYIEVELPGVKQEDLELIVEKGTLRISADRKVPDGERKCHHQERVFGPVHRSFSFSESVDPEAIEAELADGVLGIRVPKKPEAQPKRITVKGP